VQTLLQHKADVNAKNQQGHSALQLSASKGWKNVIYILKLMFFTLKQNLLGFTGAANFADGWS